MWVSQKRTVVSVWLHSELKGVKSSSLCACAWVGNDVAMAHCNLWSHLTYGHLLRLKVAENDDSFSFPQGSDAEECWSLAWKVIWLLFLMARETHADVWLDTCMCVIICKSLRGRSHIKADLCAFLISVWMWYSEVGGKKKTWLLLGIIPFCKGRWLTHTILYPLHTQAVPVFPAVANVIPRKYVSTGYCGSGW